MNLISTNSFVTFSNDSLAGSRINIKHDLSVTGIRSEFRSSPIKRTQVSKLVGGDPPIEINPEMENFTLERFLELGLQNHASDIGDIGDRSGKEPLV